MTRQKLRLAIPKGRMHGGVVGLLQGAGIRLSDTARGYRPCISLPDCEVKVLKPQNIVEMLQVGSRDLCFTGADWVAELDGRLEELQDTGLDPRLVDQVESALEAQLEGLSTAEIALTALQRGCAVTAGILSEVAALCDRRAPENLQVVTEYPDRDAGPFHHFGALFLGPSSAEVFAD